MRREWECACPSRWGGRRRLAGSQPRDRRQRQTPVPSQRGTRPPTGGGACGSGRGSIAGKRSRSGEGGRQKNLSSTTKYLGFLWHWDIKRVSVPEDKRLHILESLKNTLEMQKVSLATLRAICGKPSHLTCVLPLGRSRLHHSWDRIAAMDKACRFDPMAWVLGAGERSELQWWHDQLARPYISLQLCTEPTPDESFNLFSDASETRGLGIVIGKEFDRFKLLPGWAKRSLRNHGQNEVLGRILSLVLKNQCLLTFRYVPSASNLADPPSRGLDAPGATRRHFKGFPQRLSGILVRD